MSLYLPREGNDRGCHWVQCPQARPTSLLFVLLLKLAIRPSWRKSRHWQATPLLAPGHIPTIIHKDCWGLLCRAWLGSRMAS